MPITEGHHQGRPIYSRRESAGMRSLSTLLCVTPVATMLTSTGLPSSRSALPRTIVPAMMSGAPDTSQPREPACRGAHVVRFAYCAKCLSIVWNDGTREHPDELYDPQARAAVAGGTWITAPNSADSSPSASLFGI